MIHQNQFHVLYENAHQNFTGYFLSHPAVLSFVASEYFHDYSPFEFMPFMQYKKLLVIVHLKAYCIFYSLDKPLGNIMKNSCPVLYKIMGN